LWLLSHLNRSLAVASLGKAAAAFSRANDDGNGPVPGDKYLSCATPGTLTISGTTCTVSGCVVGGNHVDGQAAFVSVSGNQYSLSLDGISVTLPSASPVAITGRADCTVASGAAPQCVVALNPIPPLSTQTFRFGWNADHAGGIANGNAWLRMHRNQVRHAR
jgi:hypothetical protein